MWVAVSVFSTRPLEGPSGLANFPEASSLQQLSSNSVTSPPGCNWASCGQANRALGGRLKLDAFPPSLHMTPPVLASIRYAAQVLRIVTRS